MDPRVVPCALQVGEAPCIVGRGHRQPAMDDDGHRFRKVVHCFHWDAPERPARISLSRTLQNRAGFYLSYATPIYAARIND